MFRKPPSSLCIAVSVALTLILPVTQSCCHYSTSDFFLMKILEANAGALTNFEVLDFLRAKGASKDPTRVIAKVAPSEYKVYDYLVNTAACDQTRKNLNGFLENCKRHELAKAEVLNIINNRPVAAVEIFPIIEQCDDRFRDEEIEEIIELVKKGLPPPPGKEKPEEVNQGNEETAKSEHEENNDNSPDQNKDGEQMDTS
ncbi:hypothetical protein L6164_013120 [Bauhinia variegata]|uniref:Uncharacterized protein n=1 Tax=Bauhinia variegata TaxID=167791 RepID=A0ACB9PCB0_BAUVA|nr:hypothetical protein L6164_013120 [Bauhinia variegata]